MPLGRDGRITFMDLAGRRNVYNVPETDILAHDTAALIIIFPSYVNK